eukprot:SAG31_NODE_434_length_15737_cov_10.315450_5_plen_665_part_00
MRTPGAASIAVPAVELTLLWLLWPGPGAAERVGTLDADGGQRGWWNGPEAAARRTRASARVQSGAAAAAAPHALQTTDNLDPLPPQLLGNCTCSATSRLRYLGECFVVLPISQAAGEVVMAFHPSDGILLEARSWNYGENWDGWAKSRGGSNWVGSGPRCAVVEATQFVSKLICTVSVYPSGVIARSATWDAQSQVLAWNNATIPIWSGTNGGGIRHTISLANGRVLCMVQTQNGPKNGFPSSIISIYADPPYLSWHHSNAVGCSATPGSCYGAVEPVAVERRDGSLLAMMRTQTGLLWQTTSANFGTTLAPTVPTKLASSDSPPFLLRLQRGDTSAYGENRSAILLIWVNVRTTKPLLCQHLDGGGVYTVRAILHAAISIDDCHTWLGHREVYRDPLMKAQPPTRGDIGVAYSYGVELNDGTVLFATGQGIGRTQLIRLDPRWLLQPVGKTADFTIPAAATSWNRPLAITVPEYVSTCMYYRHFPPSEAFDCADGHDGTSLQRITPRARQEDYKNDGKGVVGGENTTQALCMTLASGAEMATALWNFPSRNKGVVTAIVMHSNRQTGLNASWALADAAFPPWDLDEHQSSVFVGAVPQLPPNIWSTLTFAFDLLAGTCTVALDGRHVASSMIRRKSNEGALSYLALRSLGPTSTLCVKTLSSE